MSATVEVVDAGTDVVVSDPEPLHELTTKVRTVRRSADRYELKILEGVNIRRFYAARVLQPIGGVEALVVA